MTAWDEFKEMVADLRPSVEATCGEIHDDGIDLDFIGACPVQGRGTVDGRPCYYRSRDGWSFRVFAADADMGRLLLPEPTWETEGEDGEEYGGWAKASVTIENIRCAVRAWRESGRP